MLARKIVCENKIWLNLLLLSLLLVQAFFSPVHAEDTPVESVATVEPPRYQPFEDENFALKANWNLSLAKGLVAPSVDTVGNFTNVKSVVDPVSGWQLVFNGENSSLQMLAENASTEDHLDKAMILEIIAKFYPIDNYTYGKDWSTLFSVGGDWGKAPLALLLSWNDPTRPLTLIINGTRVATVKTGFTDFTWHNITVVLSRNLTEIRLDNVAVFSQEKDSYPAIDDNSVIFIGNLDGFVYPFNGALKLARLYTLSIDYLQPVSNYSFVPQSSAIALLNVDFGDLSCFLQRSNDGVHYTNIGKIDANANTFIWSEPVPGVYYYKARIIDTKNVLLAESPVISVFVSLHSKLDLSNKPLPYLSGLVFIVCVSIAFLLDFWRRR